ncbi:hypothetical protein [Oceanobacillus sp. J11TS1]|uniref:hypothetical protein n=1 Tax=Oceanobacillus sp. J11TS1 TaxID=2807191 RepID=UPI001B0C5E59|nr:hypothetical protein [Oceanobacillus sp. J11TS1]GIO23942.1 putative lipoprotein YvcA [Oceanobacillus sp. J11TS1]
MVKRKLTIYSVLLLLILGLGGCKEVGEEKDKKVTEMSTEELPDVTAFQDEFTREFMVSTEPAKEGYYLFQSKTGGYTMMYPENAKLDKLYYDMSVGESDSSAYEGIQYGESIKEEYQYFVRATYNRGKQANNLEVLKEILKSRTSFDGEYETLDYKDKTINYATAERVTRNEKNKVYRFLGIIQSKSSSQSLSYTYNVIADEEKNIDLQSIEEDVLAIMESVEFQKLE